MRTIKVLASIATLLVAFGATARPPLSLLETAHYNFKYGDTLGTSSNKISELQFPFFYHYSSLTTVLTISGITTPYCIGATRSFTVSSNGNRPINYIWNVSPAGTIYTANGASIDITFGTAAATTISVTATYPSGVVTSSITLTNGTPTVTMSTTPISPCYGTPITVAATSNLPSTFTWNTGAIFAGANLTSTINATAGFNTYTVTVNPGNGCTAVRSINTLVKPAPTVSISPATISICSGISATLTASGTAGNTYNWSTAAMTSSITVSPTNTTTYTVTATGSNGCTSSASRVVTVNTPPIANITTVGPRCVGNTTTTFTASGGGTYLWSQGATTSSIIILNPTSPNTYTVTVTSDNGCTATSSSTIEQYVMSISGVHCFYSNPFIVQAIFNTPNSNSLYSWSYNNSIVSTSAGVSIISAGLYSITATDNLGCKATGGANIPVCFMGNTSMSGNGNNLESISNINESTPLSNINSPSSFIISPNPTSGSFNLSIKMEEPQEISIVIRDLTGRVLQERQLGKINDSNYLFDLTGYPAGMYLLSLYGEQGQLDVIKLIKE